MPEIRLVEVRSRPEAMEILWRLLSERPPEANISHRAMPSREEHARFVESNPYRCWYLVQDAASGQFAGACYLTQLNEVGIGILAAFQRRGLARAALLELLGTHEPLPAAPGARRGSFVANVAPRNAASQKLFQSLGGVQVQTTYELPRPRR